MKLRENYATKLSKIPKGAFRCILEYIEPVMFKRVITCPHENKDLPNNYSFPDEISYHNPIVALKCCHVGGSLWWWFMLQSGEKTDNAVQNNGFRQLDWS